VKCIRYCASGRAKADQLLLPGDAELSAGAVLEKQWKQIIIFPGIPDFLLRLVALSTCMRLSLKKAAHAVLSGAA
jgi:hypothetical protein